MYSFSAALASDFKRFQQFLNNFNADSQQTQNICITFVQRLRRWSNVDKCYKNVFVFAGFGPHVYIPVDINKKYPNWLLSGIWYACKNCLKEVPRTME